ncbi:MAG: hypothetical protein NBV68_18420 [Erythrobacter sp.]|uniref:hypothetical protein n=1 Tax=Erythrobacter sp. TaxID=1042 RepID=UPI0025DD9F07|nr:hypothetical protein [Erythrobacter sp.]MCM0001351.1 hypothetical protein [Erythrobacter sp.]
MAPRLRVAAVAAALAGTTILAAPAAAAPLAQGTATSTYFAPSHYDPAAETAQWGCRWNCGWGRGWGRRGWRRNRVDAGDVLIGAAIIGGALAIANSERRRQRERDVVVIERDPGVPDRDADWDRRDQRRDDRRTGSAGLDSAVDMCLDRIERDVRVDTVDDARRTPSGWEVSGSIFNGAQFRCRIGNDGRIDTIDYDGTFGAGDWRDPQASAEQPAAGQWGAEAYAAARAGLGGTVRPDMAVQEAEMRGGVAVAPTRPATAPPAAATALPAYPGGPIPGEIIPETMEEATGG